MARRSETIRETHLVVPAITLFLTWLAAHLLCMLSGVLAVVAVLAAAAFSTHAAILRFREYDRGRIAPVALSVLIGAALSSLFLPIWNHHPGAGWSGSRTFRA